MLASALGATFVEKVLFDWSFFYIYILCLVVYFAVVFKFRVARDNGKRKTLMFGTWVGK